MKFETQLLNKGDLTEREAEVLRLICNALSDKDIARALVISIKTVTSHIEHIYLKLDVRGESLNRRACVIRSAISRGMVRFMSVVLCVAMVGNDADFMRGRCRSKLGRGSVTRRLDV